MPEVLKEFPTVKRAGRTPSHPYEEWIKAAESPNGIKLVKGTDFDAEVRTIRHSLYKQAKLRDLEYETRTLKNDKGEEDALAFRILKTPKKKK
jgi:hypothetical protein